MLVYNSIGLSFLPNYFHSFFFLFFLLPFLLLFSSFYSSFLFFKFLICKICIIVLTIVSVLHIRQGEGRDHAFQFLTHWNIHVYQAHCQCDLQWDLTVIFFMILYFRTTLILIDITKGMFPFPHLTPIYKHNTIQIQTIFGEEIVTWFKEIRTGISTCQAEPMTDVFVTVPATHIIVASTLCKLNNYSVSVTNNYWILMKSNQQANPG